MLTLYYKVIKIINIVCRKNNHFYPLHTHGVPLIASGKDMLTTQIFHSGANFPQERAVYGQIPKQWACQHIFLKGYS